MKDKSTFYSGSKPYTSILTQVNSNFIALENTVPALMLDGLFFCPSGTGYNPDDPMSGFDMSSCSNYIRNVTGGPYVDALGALWEALSLNFAASSTGDVSVIFNANPTRLCYMSGSIFRSVEVPNMRPGEITSMNVMIVTNSSAPNERCGSGSLAELKQDVIQKFGNNFNFTCQNDPPELTAIRCSFNPNQQVCTVQKSNCRTQGYIIAIIGVAIGGIVVGLLIGTIVFYLKNSFKRKANNIELTSHYEPLNIN